MSEKQPVKVQFIYTTHIGPDFQADPEIESLLPDSFLEILKRRNGFCQFGGGLHTRGICSEPKWHSLREAMKGEHALHKLYSAIKETDYPFAQDCVADQYILRGEKVYRLYAETGELEPLNMSMGEFYKEVDENYSYFLGLEPLYELYGQDMKLQPGEVIQVDPPVCKVNIDRERTLKPAPALQTLVSLSETAKVFQSLNDIEQMAAGFRSNMQLSQAFNDGNPFTIADTLGYEAEETKH